LGAAQQRSVRLLDQVDLDQARPRWHHLAAVPAEAIGQAVHGHHLAEEAAPVTLIADAILDASKRNGILLDAFAGSGTTLIAAERTGRRGYGIEVDPLYVDAIIRRFEATYGIDAVLAESGDRFDDVRRRRAAEMETSDDE
jgi:hypothetical protein